MYITNILIFKRSVGGICSVLKVHSSSLAQNDNSNNQNKMRENTLEPPEEPTSCCMSGCANCVWLEYAEALSKYYHDGGEKALQEINERINDPNIKAYILHEIKMKSK